MKKTNAHNKPVNKIAILQMCLYESVLILLKACGFINWNWIWVLFPVWGAFALVGIAFGFYHIRETRKAATLTNDFKDF